MDVRAEECKFTLKNLPKFRDMILESGLTAEQATRLFSRMAGSLKDEAAFAEMIDAQSLPGLREFRTCIAVPGYAVIHRLVLALVPESAAVFVVNCVWTRIPSH